MKLLREQGGVYRNILVQFSFQPHDVHGGEILPVAGVAEETQQVVQFRTDPLVDLDTLFNEFLVTLILPDQPFFKAVEPDCKNDYDYGTKNGYNEDGDLQAVP